MMLVLGWTSCFVWMRLCWEGTVGAELKSQISGTEAPYCPRRTRAHRWWRVRTVKTALCPWALVLAPPIHHQPVVPTGLLTSYWPCSLIIRSAQNTHTRTHKHPQTPRWSHDVIWAHCFAATLSSSPQQDPELVSVIVPSCCCVSTERSTRSSTPTGKSPPQMLAGPVGWPLFPSIPRWLSVNVST